MISFTEVRLIDNFQFDRLVVSTYGRPYSLQQHGGEDGPMGQESMVRFEVPEVEHYIGAVPLARWLERAPSIPMDFKEDLEWRREFTPRFDELVNDLWEKDLLDAGSYVVRIWW